jgi:hypothetical protein
MEQDKREDIRKYIEEMILTYGFQSAVYQLMESGYNRVSATSMVQAVHDELTKGEVR